MATFLLEIRTEEIPANALPGARRQLERHFSTLFEESGFREVSLRALSTSLRLVVEANNLPERQDDRTEELTGPPIRVAFDGDGKPTRAAEGFAKKAGTPLEQIRRITTDKGEYLAATVTHKGRTTTDILAEATPKILGALRFPKMMRWGLGTSLFVRPVHGILALLDEAIVAFEAFGVTSGRKTVGHRVHSPAAFELDHAGDLENALGQRSVMLDPARRHEVLMNRSSELAAEASCKVHQDPRLVAEHIELVEWPGFILGSFKKRYLDLPPEVVVSTLRHHQKCLILETDDGDLEPHFIAVVDRKDDPEGLVRQGNEWVIGARLADAGFFFDEDRKRPLEDLAIGLDRVEWHRVLGTLEAKAQRVAELASSLDEMLDLGIGRASLAHAARLVKADLLTNMVGEFPDLQGVMGGHYLRLEGADEALWTAARDHYRPVGFDGLIPESPMGRVLGLGDRLDTIAGLFSVGEIPTGSRDPLGLRRAAQAAVKIFAEAGWNMDLKETIALAVKGLGAHATEPETTQAQVVEFFADRVRRWLTDVAGVAGDTADAVMAAGWHNIPATVARAEALDIVRTDTRFRNLALAFKRVQNITADQPEGEVAPGLFEHDEETELYTSILEFQGALEKYLPAHEITGAFEAMAPIADVLDRFFVEVLVMADDPAVRHNRISLLKQLGRGFLTLADLSKLQIDGGES